jgi:hypothetical protein
MIFYPPPRYASYAPGEKPPIPRHRGRTIFSTRLLKSDRRRPTWLAGNLKTKIV